MRKASSISKSNTDTMACKLRIDTSIHVAEGNRSVEQLIKNSVE